MTYYSELTHKIKKLSRYSGYLEFSYWRVDDTPLVHVTFYSFIRVDDKKVYTRVIRRFYHKEYIIKICAYYKTEVSSWVV